MVAGADGDVCRSAYQIYLTSYSSTRFMKQILQNQRTGELTVAEVPLPVLQRGRVLVRTAASLVSAGTERMSLQLAQKGLLGKARQRPDLVKQVVQKYKTEGLV